MMDGEVCWFTPDVHVVVIPKLALMKEGWQDGTLLPPQFGKWAELRADN